jgi:hypothetical protein
LRLPANAGSLDLVIIDTYVAPVTLWPLADPLTSSEKRKSPERT